MSLRAPLTALAALVLLAACGDRTPPLPGERLDLRDGLASAQTTQPNRAAPLLGADSDAVLAEAGFEAGEIADLRAEGVI